MNTFIFLVTMVMNYYLLGKSYLILVKKEKAMEFHHSFNSYS